MNKEILFISYDGLTDPLGQSQILPYIIGLSKAGYHFTILSCEKETRYKNGKNEIRSIVARHNIDWYPIKFTTVPPIIAKYWDIIKLRRKAVELYKSKRFSMTHCRSYISADIGLFLKKRYGVKFFFDMRGFWVDERVEGGLWNIKNPIYRMAYQYYKKREGKLIANADVIVALTNAGKKEIEGWRSYNGNKIGVIPCSADFSVFSLSTSERERDAKGMLKIPDSTFVLSYLGSIGTWYLLEEMLDFFKILKTHYPASIFLFITPEPKCNILPFVLAKGLQEKDIKVEFAARTEVSKMLNASDINIFFIKESYSKIASSPTKLGEVLAAGIPVICNSKVGDVGEIMANIGAGSTVENFSPDEYERVILEIPSLLDLDPKKIRENAFSYYDLATAISSYIALYKEILDEK